MPGRYGVSAAGRLPRTTLRCFRGGSRTDLTLRSFLRKVASSHEPIRSRSCLSARRELELDAEEVPGLGGRRTSDGAGVKLPGLHHDMGAERGG